MEGSRSQHPPPPPKIQGDFWEAPGPWPRAAPSPSISGWQTRGRRPDYRSPRIAVQGYFFYGPGGPHQTVLWIVESGCTGDIEVRHATKFTAPNHCTPLDETVNLATCQNSNRRAEMVLCLTAGQDEHLKKTDGYIGHSPEAFSKKQTHTCTARKVTSAFTGTQFVWFYHWLLGQKLFAGLTVCSAVCSLAHFRADTRPHRQSQTTPGPSHTQSRQPMPQKCS